MEKYNFFNLLMRREFAEQILAGEKKLELRDASDFYISRFLIEENGEYYMKPDKNALHFHNYNNSWFLDVEFTDLVLLEVTSKNIKKIQKEGYHEFDEMLEEVKQDEKNNIEPSYLFYFKLGKVIDTDLHKKQDVNQPKRKKKQAISNKDFIDAIKSFGGLFGRHSELAKWKFINSLTTIGV